MEDSPSWTPMLQSQRNEKFQNVQDWILDWANKPKFTVHTQDLLLIHAAVIPESRIYNSQIDAVKTIIDQTVFRAHDSWHKHLGIATVATMLSVGM